MNFDKEDFLKKILSILFANILSAAAIVFFIKPSQMISGGVNGIAIILEYLTGIPLGLLVLAFNIPLMFMAVKFLDREFAVYTVISVFLLSGCISVFEYIKPENMVIAEEMILACIYGGVIRGVGSGILFKNNASSGGFDIVAAIVKKYYNISIGKVSLFVNLFIVALSAFIFSPSKAMYTLVSLAISYRISDIIQLNVGKQKQVFIISEKNKDIAHDIQEILDRGITYLDGKGAYAHENFNVIYLVCTPRELVKVKNLVEEEDSRAFIAVTDTAEIRGRGFEEIAI